MTTVDKVIPDAASAAGTAASGATPAHDYAAIAAQFAERIRAASAAGTPLCCAAAAARTGMASRRKGTCSIHAPIAA
jgi:hypothetical protein